jgi:hypothetical protein
MNIEAHAWVDVAGQTITAGEELTAAFMSLGSLITATGNVE